MAKLDASQVAAMLAEYGRRSALRGGNPYRSKAYIRAAENLAALAEPLERIVEEGRLRSHVWGDGRYLDLVYMGILRDEFSVRASR